MLKDGVSARVIEDRNIVQGRALNVVVVVVVVVVVDVPFNVAVGSI